MAAVTNNHKPFGLKQHQFIFSQFWSPESEISTTEEKSTCQQDLAPFKTIPQNPFLLLLAPGIPWNSLACSYVTLIVKVIIFKSLPDPLTSVCVCKVPSASLLKRHLYFRTRQYNPNNLSVSKSWIISLKTPFCHFKIAVRVSRTRSCISFRRAFLNLLYHHLAPQDYRVSLISLELLDSHSKSQV